MHKLILFYSYLMRLLLYFLPNIPFIMRLRGWLYGLAMAKCGKNFQVAADARLSGLEFMRIGNNCYVAPGVILLISNKLTLHDEVMLGPYVVVADGNHSVRGGSYRYGERSSKPIEIGRGCWLGAHVCVISGAILAEGSLVGANSVVVGGHPPFARIGGVPARLIEGTG
jgi:maltose O-acetyltransferase